MKAPLCPHCGKMNDAMMDPESRGKPPFKGCLSMCVYCGEFSIFEEDLSLRALTEDEINNIKIENPDLIISMHKAKEFFKRVGPLLNQRGNARNN